MYITSTHYFFEFELEIWVCVDIYINYKLWQFLNYWKYFGVYIYYHRLIIIDSSVFLLEFLFVLIPETMRNVNQTKVTRCKQFLKSGTGGVGVSGKFSLFLSIFFNFLEQNIQNLDENVQKIDIKTLDLVSSVFPVYFGLTEYLKIKKLPVIPTPCVPHIFFLRK